MTLPAARVRAAWWDLRPKRVLLAGALGLLLLRLLVSVARSGPVIMADEAGYLMHARVLAGGMPAEMGSSPFYRGGYSLLLAPMLSLDGDPVGAYHGVLVVNALLAACLVPLLYVLLTRCFRAGRQVAAWAAVAGAAYPSVTALSQVALAENLLFPLTVAWLLCAGSLLHQAGHHARVGAALGAGVCAAALWTAHGRMIVLVGLTCALLFAMLIARRRTGEAAVAIAGLTALAAGLLGGALLNDWLFRQNYRGPRFDEIGHALSAVDHLDGILALAANLAGQTWYLLVATLGLVLLLLAGDVPTAARRLMGRRASATDAVLLVAVAATVGLLVESAVWFATRTRPDQLLYGRYVEPMAPILVSVGIVALARSGRTPRLAPALAGFAALTVLVALIRAGLDLPVKASRWNVASLPSVTGELGPPIIALAAVIMTAALVLLLAVRARAPGALGPLVIVLFAPTTAYITHLPVLRSEHDVYPPGWTSPVAAAHGAKRVGYDVDHFDHIAVKVYQWFMPNTRMVPFASHAHAPPAALFFSGRRLSGKPAGCGAAVVWRDPGRDQVLWRAPPGRCGVRRQ